MRFHPKSFSVLVFLLLVVTAPAVLAQDVTLTALRTFISLDGSLDDADGNADGCFTVIGDLHVGAPGLPGGILFDDPALPTAASAGAICIHVGGSLEILDGSRISAQNLISGGSGGNVTITCGDCNLRGPGVSPQGGLIVTNRSGGTSSGAAGSISIDAGGSVSIAAGAAIRADANSGASAGAILIHAAGTITVLGLVSSESQMTGTGAVQRPGGGPVTLLAGPGITVQEGGIVRSRGLDPGADLVHLEACAVTIGGLVESTGHGHAIPNSPPNHLGPPNRPDKPAASTAGVEIWARSILIDHVAASGTVNADTAQAGGSAGRAWIDLIAGSSLVVLGDPTPGSTAFAIHANQFVTNSHGGAIHLLCKDGPIAAGGAAIQVDALPGGSSGGSIQIEAAGAAQLSSATLFARGDFNQTGGYGWGGHVSVRSFASSVDWGGGIGDVRPTGTDDVSPVLTAAQKGTIQITCATSSSVAGTSFLANGLPATAPAFDVDGSSSQPSCAAYVALPPCLCDLPMTATVVDLGPGCGGLGSPVMAIAPAPVVGGSATLSITSNIPSTMVKIYASACGAQPTPVPGSTCMIYADMASLMLLVMDMTLLDGSFSVTIPVPADPMLVGMCFVLQAIIWSPEIGADGLTNGLQVTIGCE